MHIERLQVEGGFLDGLDVEFVEGLNVIIGARGTGKTSIVEVLRYVLGARNHTTDAEKRSLAHARAILSDGEATATLGDIIETIVVTRGAGDEQPRAHDTYPVPLVLSQTEIETLGLSEGGRLRLLDSFWVGRSGLREEEAAAVSAVRSAFKEVKGLESELVSAGAGLDQLPVLQERSAQLASQELAYQESSIGLSEKQAQLSVLNEQSASVAVQEEVLARFDETTEAWTERLNELVEEDFGVEGWSGPEDGDPLSPFRQRYDQAIASIRSAAVEFQAMRREAAASLEPARRRRAELEVQARALRAEIGQTAEGAAGTARALAQVRTQLAQLEARAKLVQDRQRRLEQLRARRDERLVELEKVRRTRSSKRMEAAKEISEALHPQIQVVVQPLGQFSDYARGLVESLRGSGLKYNDLAEAISTRVSPKELVKFVDRNDFVGLSDAAQLPRDRAARLIGHLRETGMSDIATANIDDDVKMTLLDGVEYKNIQELSAGQRCTVVLSMVLQHTQRILVIDQPEDHLDNAYIATTVVKALRNRKGQTQIILTTHNANIPVLGSADLVIELTSDGRHGYIQVCKPLMHVDAVDAITKVMEGGREAFQQRAEFYDEHTL